MGSRGVHHVVMLPWFAFGHMIPFFHLSTALAKAGLRVSFISTRKNIQRLPPVPLNLVSRLKLVEFTLPKVEGLPEGAEATVDIVVSEIPSLRTAYDLMKDQLMEFMDAESPDLIVQDFIPYWTTNITEELSTPRIMLSVFSASTLAFFGPPEAQTIEAQMQHWPTPESMTVPPEWINFPSTVAFRTWDAKIIFVVTKILYNTSQGEGNRLARAFQTCHAVAIRSCNEYEGEYLNLLNTMFKKPVIPFGVLPPPKVEIKNPEHEIFKWLDKQKHKSVVYVAFGSEAKLQKDQVDAIANGLEMAKLPFFWALRKPEWAAENDDDAILPPGFKIRTSSFGMVLIGWAPQLEILAHPSVGCSLFHSGWGSIIETLQHGHTPIVLPLIFDQRLNARLLVEKGLAVEVDTSEEDGSFDASDVARVLTRAMVNEKGEDLRISTTNMGDVFGNEGLQYEHYLAQFVSFIKNIGAPNH